MSIKTELTRQQVEQILGPYTRERMDNITLQRISIDLNRAFRPQGLAFSVGTKNTQLTVGTTIDGKAVNFTFGHRW